LFQEFNALVDEQKSLLIKNEFDRIYVGQGASGMNAGTSQDFTIYFINVPANKLELWFWMESERLLNPIFREFYTEIENVKEERRLGIDSQPDGVLWEAFLATAFTAHRYGTLVIGWMSDIETIIRTAWAWHQKRS